MDGDLAAESHRDGYGLTVVSDSKVCAPSAEDGFAFPPSALVEIFLCSDVFVLPTLIEGLANVLLEAMAAHLPIIATDVPGCRDVIRHGWNGLLVPPRDPRAMADAVLSLARDPAQCRQLVANGKDHVQQFDWPIVAAKYRLLYQQLIEESRAARARA